MKFPRPSTLHVALPIGQTLALAIPILLVFMGALELVLRVPAVESRLPAPDLGSSFITLGCWRGCPSVLQTYRLRSNTGSR
jgi:hypothetical protein